MKAAKIALLGSTVAFIALGQPVHAEQVRDSTELSEIIVTAQKRTENLQNVPASIVVATGELLRASHIDGLGELYRAAPGFNMRGGTRTSNGVGLTLRGLGTVSIGGGIQPSVATVVDGVVMGRQGIVSLLNFNDIERVEILRGPQGTLFGMNASAGVLNLVTKNPTEDFFASIGAGYGSYHETHLDGSVSGPLFGDKLLARLSLYSSKRDGYVENLNPAVPVSGRFNNGNEQRGARLKLLFQPNEGTKLLLTGDIAEDERHYGVGVARFLNLPPTTPASDPSEIAALSAIAGPKNHFEFGTAAGLSKVNLKGVSLQWDQDIGTLELTSITAYREFDSSNVQHGDLSPAPIQSIMNNNADFFQHQFSQELRIASPTGGALDYVIGGFLFKQRFQTDVIQDAKSGSFLFSANYFSVVDTLNYAAFGEANYHLGNGLTFFGGGRWTHEKLEFLLDTRPLPAGVMIRFGPAGRAVDTTSSDTFSWRGGARWEVNKANTVYGTVSRGFKGAGFNSNSTLVGASQRVAPERSTNYEIGWKARLLENRLRTSLSFFLTDFSNFQAVSLVNTGNLATSGYFLSNVGKLRSKGVEFEVEVVPVSGLNLAINGAYVDAQIRSFPAAQCYSGQTVAQGCVVSDPLQPTRFTQNLAGATLPNSPKYSLNGSANYDFPIAGASFGGFVRAEVNWHSKIQYDLLQDPRGIEGGYALVGLSAGLQGADERWKLSVFVKNLTNKFHVDGITPSSANAATTTHDVPSDYQRIFGTNVRVNF